MEGAAAPDFASLASLMRSVASKTCELAGELELLFVTNLQHGTVADLGPQGVLNTAQYYTRRQADEIVRSFRDLGLSVTPFFDELDFIAAVARHDRLSGTRQPVVYTTAEGGTGSGRRALIPALCNLLSLPVLNSGAHACSLARHKFHANAVLRRVGVRTPGTWEFDDGRWQGGLKPDRGTRVILKPTWEGMCIGVGDDSVQVVDAEFAEFASEKNRAFGQPVLVQEFVSGEEVGVPIARIGRTYALPPVAFRRADGEPYGHRPKTFRDEVLDNNTSFVPFEFSGAMGIPLLQAAVLAFDALEMRGAGRVDFRIDADGRAWVFDTNESPPPLKSTSYAVAMQLLGFSHHDMLAVWLGSCLLDFGLISGV
jgi:D-alanine-D-alanine ligase